MTKTDKISLSICFAKFKWNKTQDLCRSSLMHVFFHFNLKSRPSPPRKPSNNFEPSVDLLLLNGSSGLHTFMWVQPFVFGSPKENFLPSAMKIVNM